MKIAKVKRNFFVGDKIWFEFKNGVFHRERIKLYGDGRTLEFEVRGVRGYYNHGLWYPT